MSSIILRRPYSRAKARGFGIGEETDNKEGQYWDPLSDFYIDHEEIAMLQQQIFDKISGSFS
jgi:hypothetical protein